MQLDRADVLALSRAILRVHDAWEVPAFHTRVMRDGTFVYGAFGTGVAKHPLSAGAPVTVATSSVSFGNSSTVLVDSGWVWVLTGGGASAAGVYKAPK